MRILRSCIVRIGRAASWLTLVIIILIGCDVMLRYAFNATQVWIIELEWHLFGLSFLLCGAWSWLMDRHVSIDIIYASLSSRRRKTIDQLGTLLLAIPWIIVVIYSTFQYAAYSLMWKEGSPDPGGLPCRYVIKFALTFGFVLMLLTAIVRIFDAQKPQQ